MDGERSFYSVFLGFTSFLALDDVKVSLIGDDGCKREVGACNLLVQDLLYDL